MLADIFVLYCIVSMIFSVIACIGFVCIFLEWRDYLKKINSKQAEVENDIRLLHGKIKYLEDRHRYANESILNLECMCKKNTDDLVKHTLDNDARFNDIYEWANKLAKELNQWQELDHKKFDVIDSNFGVIFNTISEMRHNDEH